MKILSLMAGMLILIASTISPTSLNGRFVVLNRDNSKLTVQLQINTNSGIDDLGGATIVIGFNKSVLSFSSNPVDQTDYIFNNFSGGYYGTAKVTKPMSDKIWINIDLPYNNNNKGAIVTSQGNWTNVVTLNFNVIVPNDTVLFKWIASSPFWGAYDGNNTTMWTNGTLADLNILQVDKTPLDITGVTANNSRTITVKFSKKLNQKSAANKNNFNISNGISINQVQLQPDSSSVVLKTSQQQSNVDYILTVTDVSDQNGILISPNPKTANYNISKRSRGGKKSKNSVSQAITSSWEQDYLPDKMIDGFGMSTTDSRWESAKTMPDTIIYDLGENVVTDSLRISFYKGETGRLYKYSVNSSKDLNNWDLIVDEIWSDNSEWTTLEIDSTRTRYVQLILEDCNQANKSSIWEFESYGTEKKEQGANTSNPTDFVLMQNYPNPFNPSTKISWQSPVGSMQILKVYDILGNEIATLVNEYMGAGQHEVEFEATNLASGIYIYRLQADGYAENKKMVLLR